MTSAGSGRIRAALLTPLGPAGITVLQVVGCGAVDLVRKILRDPKNRPINLEGKSNRIIRGYIVDASESRVDEVLVCWQRLAEPIDEAVDICGHGGIRPGQKIMAVLAEAGARPVDAQELPAVGLASLAELTGGSYRGVAAEVLNHLCRAATDLVVRILLEQLEGGLTAELNRLLSEELSVEQLGQSIDQLLATWTLGKRLTEPATVAVTGPVNSGKSSLANLLSGQRGSIVNSQAGTTRDWVSHHVSLDGLPVVLIDTAGRRSATDALEAQAIRRAVQQSRHADLQLLVIDGTIRSVHLPEPNAPTVVAVNKADLDDWSFDVIPPEFAECICVKTSALTGLGLAELTLALLKALDCESLSLGGPVIFTDRQRRYLQQAAHALEHKSEEPSNLVRESLAECLHG